MDEYIEIPRLSWASLPDGMIATDSVEDAILGVTRQGYDAVFIPYPCRPCNVPLPKSKFFSLCRDFDEAIQGVCAEHQLSALKESILTEKIAQIPKWHDHVIDKLIAVIARRKTGTVISYGDDRYMAMTPVNSLTVLSPRVSHTPPFLLYIDEEGNYQKSSIDERSRPMPKVDCRGLWSVFERK